MPQIIQLSIFDDKWCSSCGLTKSVDEFHVCRRQRDGKAVWCKKCMGEYTHQWHLNNREKQLERFRKYRQEKPDYFHTYGQKYYIENKDRVNAYNREAHKQKKIERNKKRQQWRQTNRAKCNELWQRRRARLKGAPGSYTAQEWLALRNWFENKCLCCGTHDDLTTDHVIPLVQGGTNDIGNLQPLCRVCNSAKHNKTIDYRDPVLLKAFLDQL